MRSGNPALNDSTFNSFRGGAYESSNAMTITGTATKTMILLGLCIGTASMSWGMVAGQNMGAALPWMIGGLVGGLIFGLATGFVNVGGEAGHTAFTQSGPTTQKQPSRPPELRTWEYLVLSGGSRDS